MEDYYAIKDKQILTTMEDYYALAHHRLVLLLLLITLVSLSTTSTTTTRKSNCFVTKLIHRDSVFSPYYNTSATISGRAKLMIESSMARIAYLDAMTKSYSYSLDDIRGDVVPSENSHLFFVNVSIGEPPVPQLVAMDTGSNLFWIQCLPCAKCYNQSSPMFDPSKSSTYARLSCDSSDDCPDFFGCDSSQTCTYDIHYSDGTSSKGNLAVENLTLVTSDEGIANVGDIVFGCGHDNHHVLASKYSGILGLAMTDISMVSQLGSKFSYCIGNITDPQYKYNQLILGEGAKIEGYSTPIEIDSNGKYYLTLLGIRVGEKLLDINSKTFERSSGKGGVTIDSGSMMTYLPRDALEPLRTEVESLIDGLLEPVIDDDYPELVCYQGVPSRDLKGFPMVTFHFAEEADLVLDIDNMFFIRKPDMFCMAAWARANKEKTTIGILAQQYYNFAYDLDTMKMYFQRIDCELLED